MFFPKTANKMPKSMGDAKQTIAALTPKGYGSPSPH
jgi:hypothetical protein